MPNKYLNDESAQRWSPPARVVNTGASITLPADARRVAVTISGYNSNPGATSLNSMTVKAGNDSGLISSFVYHYPSPPLTLDIETFGTLITGELTLTQGGAYMTGFIQETLINTNAEPN